MYQRGGDELLSSASGVALGLSDVLGQGIGLYTEVERPVAVSSAHRRQSKGRAVTYGPLGVMARRMLVLPDSDREKRRRWLTPRGPHMLT